MPVRRKGYRRRRTGGRIRKQRGTKAYVKYQSPNEIQLLGPLGRNFGS